MSCLYCDRCDWLIDSDEDCDCFIETRAGADVGRTIIACESCRNDMAESGELDFETNTLIPTPVSP